MVLLETGTYAKKLKELGYDRTWMQCWNNMDVDSVLGTRAASTPPVLLDTGKTDLDHDEQSTGSVFTPILSLQSGSC